MHPTTNTQGYDIIGDVHGYTDELEALLQMMGYRQIRGIYQHATRKAIFVGDIIDSGPKILSTYEIVRSMCDSGNALAILGNHEVNALASQTFDKSGKPYLPDGHKAWQQHQSMIDQFPSDIYQEAIGWLRTLPFHLELDDLRIVHASWDEASASLLTDVRESYPIINQDFFEYANAHESVHRAMNLFINGLTIPLPDNIIALDSQNKRRKELRIKWHENPTGHTYNSYVMKKEEIDSDALLEPNTLTHHTPYHETEKPIFFGHYNLNEKPSLLKPNIACLDYGIADKHNPNGSLAAYRWQSETGLIENNFITQSRIKMIYM